MPSIYSRRLHGTWPTRLRDAWSFVVAHLNFFRIHLLVLYVICLNRFPYRATGPVERHLRYSTTWAFCGPLWDEDQASSGRLTNVRVISLAPG